MTPAAISVIGLLGCATVACGQDVPCDRAARSDAASAYAWVSHSFIPQRSSAFILLVTLPTDARLPSTVDVGSLGRWWRAPISREDAGTSGVLRAMTQGDAPAWLKQVDSVDVCLVLRRGGSARLIRLPRVPLLQVS